jgi:hypothetical protein
MGDDASHRLPPSPVRKPHRADKYELGSLNGSQSGVEVNVLMSELPDHLIGLNPTTSFD